MGFTEDDRETLGAIKQALEAHGEAISYNRDDIRTNQDDIGGLQGWQNMANGALKLVLASAVLLSTIKLVVAVF